MRGDWTAADLGYDRSRLPVVPHVKVKDADLCRARGTDVGYRCTRPRGHTGRHHAEGFEGTIHAVWGGWS